MKTYNTPEIEIAYFNKCNIVTESLPIDPNKTTPSVGAPDRYDDDED